MQPKDDEEEEDDVDDASNSIDDEEVIQDFDYSSLEVSASEEEEEEEEEEEDSQEDLGPPAEGIAKNSYSTLINEAEQIPKHTNKVTTRKDSMIISKSNPKKAPPNPIARGQKKSTKSNPKKQQILLLKDKRNQLKA